MGKKDPRIDDYIANAQPFARPILKHLRKLVHQGCPDAEETIKWGFPHFDHHGIMASMAALNRAVFSTRSAFRSLLRRRGISAPIWTR